VSRESAAPLALALDAGAGTARRLRRRGLANLLRKGHCAPSVMQAVLDVSGTDAEWLVKLTAGLPGGIGNTGCECGGVTAPLLLLGLRHGLEAKGGALPIVVEKGQELLCCAAALHGSVSCSEIRGTQRVPLRCVGVVRQAPVLCARVACSDGDGTIPAEQRAAYETLCAHWTAAEFHCAHAVFRALEDTVPVTPELLDATAGFMAGTAFAGMTCSALTAGVLALGLARGEIEDSRRRVLRMIGTMAVGGNAFADSLNAFNRSMNRGHRLARWFAAQHGSTQCRAITRCDFATAEGVQRYIDGGGTARCRALAESVAERVRGMIRPERAPASGGAPVGDVAGSGPVAAD
jgi:C_GCAxxG_C_C family probable redox protein